MECRVRKGHKARLAHKEFPETMVLDRKATSVHKGPPPKVHKVWLVRKVHLGLWEHRAHLDHRARPQRKVRKVPWVHKA